LLELDAYKFSKLLLRHADEPPAVPDALPHVHVHWMSHAFLLIFNAGTRHPNGCHLFRTRCQGQLPCHR
jgi:hypothetical protein